MMTMDTKTPQLENRLIQQVLDRGFVYLVDAMGGDHSVVQAARVCYLSVSRDPALDKKLLRRLWDSEHMTPFEHCVLKFHVKAPLFVARQWMRHRSSSYNEMSQRYAEVTDDFYVPDEWRAQDPKDKQGSHGGISMPNSVFSTEEVEKHCAESLAIYRRLLDRGVAREMARMVLPTNVFTQFYWTVNARNFLAFVKLRSEKHAQWEMRQYSNAMWRVFAKHMPWTAEAFLAGLDLQRYVAEGGGTAGPCQGDLA
jgi:thymidylate synthase (FAD)